MRNVSSLEALERDYAPKGVKFHFIYKALAHPGVNDFVQPFTLEERIAQAKEASRRLGTQITWLVDAMDNRLKHALGDKPNSEFLIDPEGRIARKRVWSNPQQLRRDLIELVGPVENPTRPEDIHLNQAPPPKTVARGVVEPIARPAGARALRVEPHLDGDDAPPFYAKLRAEAGRDLLKSGEGKLYLGFFLDPIYHVHWNNLTTPLTISFGPSEGVETSPETAQGPKVEEAADIDPREFLVDVTGWSSTQPIELSVQYYTCSDDPAWCRIVNQQYTIRLEPDPDAGRPMRAGGSFGSWMGRAGPMGFGGAMGDHGPGGFGGRDGFGPPGGFGPPSGFGPPGGFGPPTSGRAWWLDDPEDGAKSEQSSASVRAWWLDDEKETTKSEKSPRKVKAWWLDDPEEKDPPAETP